MAERHEGQESIDFSDVFVKAIESMIARCQNLCTPHAPHVIASASKLLEWASNPVNKEEISRLPEYLKMFSLSLR